MPKYGSGKGATLVFSNNPVALTINSISLGSKTRTPVDVSNLSSGEFMEKVSGDITDHGSVSVQGFFDGEEIPVKGVMDLVTITFPLRPGQATASIWSGQAFINSYNPLENVAINEPIRFSMTITWKGEPPPAWTASTAT